MRIVALAMSFFATIWWTTGIWASNASWIFYCVPIIVSALLIVTALRQVRPIALPSGQKGRIGRVFGIASGFEGVAIVVAFMLSPKMQSLDFSVSVQAIIVGLHCIPIARWLPAPLLYISAALLVSLGAIGFAIGDPDLHVRYVCLGAACTLWLSYGLGMRTEHERRRLRASPSAIAPEGRELSYWKDRTISRKCCAGAADAVENIAQGHGS